MSNATVMILKGDTSTGYGNLDKSLKAFKGLLFWYEYNMSSHVMILDSDDLVLPEINHLLFNNTNIVMQSGYQKIGNRVYLYKKDFYYHCGSSFIFTRDYIKEQLKLFNYEEKWMFHQNHDLSKFYSSYIPVVIQRCWHGENVWWKKMRMRDRLKWFVSQKFEF